MRQVQIAFLALIFFVNTVLVPGGISYAQDTPLFLPKPNELINLTSQAVPPILKGISLDPKNPFRFQFFADTGSKNINQEDFSKSMSQQIRYFMAGLATPYEDLWVNLSPYEKDRVIPTNLGITELGRDLLAQDYVLKQLSSSLTYPNSPMGKEFWKQVYKNAQEVFGTTQVPINTYHKVWIVPAKAVVYSKENMAYILESHLKVMMEKDYLASQKNTSIVTSSVPDQTKDVSEQVMRQVIIPALEKEINEGQSFFQLRQIYSALILATWFKEKSKNSFLGVNYVNQNNVNGIDTEDKNIPKEIFQQYVQAYKKGVYNFISEEFDAHQQKVVPRKYFSGGVVVGENVKRTTVFTGSFGPEGIPALSGTLRRVDVGSSVHRDAAMSAKVKPLTEVLSINRLEYFNTKTNQRENFKQKKDSLDKRYQDFMIELGKANVGLSGQLLSNEETEQRQLEIEIERAEIVKEWYEIGRNHLKGVSTGSSEERYHNYLVALIAFKKVSEMQPMLRATYNEFTQTSEFRPPMEVLEGIMSPDGALELVNKLPFEKREAFKKFAEVIILVKDNDQLYKDSIQWYLSEVDDAFGIGVAAVENIVYDLGISDTILARGITNKDGRSFDQLLSMVLYLREMLFTEDGRISSGMKVQAAEYLNALLTNHMRFGQSRDGLDFNGGLSVPQTVYDLNLGKKNLGRMAQAEKQAFATFMEDARTATLSGHSYTAMDWLASFYRQFSKYYYQENGAGNVAEDMARHRPQRAAAIDGLKKLDSWQEMMDAYKRDFKPVSSEFKPGGAFSGVVASLPVRIEDSAGGIGDSTFLSKYRKEFYRILNHAGELSREDGTVGRSVDITFEVRDRRDMQETFLSMESLDNRFLVTVGNSNDAAKKSKADLVLQTLVSLGLFPQPLLDKARQEGKELETAREVCDHVFGKGKGLSITMHVKGISAGSGLAISSIIAMGTATAFDVLLGQKAKRSPSRLRVNRLRFQNQAQGFYYVQVSKDQNFDPQKSKVYQFPTRSVEGSVEVDLIPDEMPTGDGRYFVRLAKIQDETDIKDVKEQQWASQNLSWQFKQEINIQGAVTNDAHVQNEEGLAGVSVKHFDQEFMMMDDEENTARAIVASQTTVSRMAGKAGTQDELSGLGGMVLSFANGDSMVPQMVRVRLSPETITNMNHALKVIRIGISEPAEDTLDQVFTNSMLNASREVQNIWAQAGLEMMKAYQRGDLLAVGDWAYRMVALRQKVAPVSINPQVLNVFEDFVRRYGLSHHFRYGITGARSSGSILIFFDPQTSSVNIQRIMKELEVALMKARQDIGKVGVYEEPAHTFEDFKFSPRGTAVRLMTPTEMVWFRERVLKPNAAFKEAQSRHDQKERVSYSPNEWKYYVEKYGFNTGLVKSPASHDTNSVLTIAIELQSEIDRLVRNNSGQALKPEDIEELHQIAERLIRKNYAPFKAPGANSKVRALIQERLKKTIVLIEGAKLTPAQEHLLFAAVGQGQINLSWNFTSVDQIKGICDSLQRDNVVDEQFAGPLKIEYAEFQRQLVQLEKEYEGQLKDGKSLLTSEFRSDLNLELKKIEEVRVLIEDAIGKTSGLVKSSHEENLRVLNHLGEMLKEIPTPEDFSFGHFIYRLDDFYKSLQESYGGDLIQSSYDKHFGSLMKVLEDAVAEGAFVDFPLFGGVGARAFGGKVKGAVPFQMGDESETTFLKLAIRNWAAFLAKFPSRRKAISNILVSAFTEDAIKAVYQGYLKENNLDDRTVGLISSSMREVVRPTELELSLALALQVTATEEERNELKRKYDWYISVTNKELDKQKKTDETLTRPVYKDEGLNPLNGYAPSGNGSSIESMLVETNPIYTEKNLREMGYELDENRLAIVRSTQEGSAELENGMTLATASLLVKGKGLSLGIIRNGTGFAQLGGGDINLGRAAQEILGDIEHKLAVVQYANVAAGADTGGVLVRKRNADGTLGAVTTLEGHRIQFAERYIFSEDQVSIATGVNIVNLKIIWKVLGYRSAEEYLKASEQEKKQRAADYMNNKWPKTIAMRMRVEEKPGERYEWPALQLEVPAQWIWEYAQEQPELGINVSYHEVTAEVGYQDPKTKPQLQEMLSRANPRNVLPIRTKLSPGNVENSSEAIQKKLDLARFYLKDGLVFQAKILSERARWSWAEAVDLKDRSEWEVRIIEVEREISAYWDQYKGSIEEKKGRVDLERSERDLVQLLESGFIDKEKKAGVLRAKQLEISQLIQNMDAQSFIALKDPIESLAKLLVDKDRNRMLAASVINSVLLGEDIQDSLNALGVRLNLTNSQRVEILKVIKQVQDANGQDLLSLSFLRQEYMAIYEHLGMRINPDDYKDFVLSPHKIFVYTDKDATTEDPGVPLKPGRSLQFIKAAQQGVNVVELTGSTVKEGWDQVLSIIAADLNRMEMPTMMKRIIASRIRVLANDGSVSIGLEVNSTGQVVASKINYTSRYRGGEWYEIDSSILLKQKDGKENKDARLIYWNTTARAFLKQFFAQGIPASFVNENVSDFRAEELDAFIDQLGLTEEDGDIVNDFLTSNAQENFLDIQVLLTSVLRRMLKHFEALNPNNRFTLILNKILESEVNAKAKISDVNRKKEVLAPQEQIYLALNGILMKESAGTYGSINADPLEHLRDGDDRLVSISELIINRLFWEQTHNKVQEGFKEAIIQQRFLGQSGNVIDFELRPGPGYLNMVFGGVSKKNYLSAMLQEQETEGKICLILGDSLKDQGNFPFNLYFHTASDLQESVNRIKSKLIEMARKSLADKITFSWNPAIAGGTGSLYFSGEISEEELKVIKEIIEQVATGKEKGNLIKAFASISEQSKKVHTRRIPYRVLLGTIFEADDLEKERVAKAGLVRTGYSFTQPNPYFPNRLERWGPAAFYPTLNALIRVASRGVVIPAGSTEDNIARLSRALIIQMNASGVAHVKVIPPVATKKLSSSDRAQTATGGIDLRSIVGLVYDSKGVPVNFNWQNQEKVRLKEVIPVVYSIKNMEISALEGMMLEKR